MIASNREVPNNRQKTAKRSRTIPAWVKILAVLVLGVAMNLVTMPNIAGLGNNNAKRNADGADTAGMALMSGNAWAESRRGDRGGHRSSGNRGYRGDRGYRGNRGDRGYRRDSGYRRDQGHRRSGVYLGRGGNQSGYSRDSRRLRELRGYRQERSRGYVGNRSVRHDNRDGYRDRRGRYDRGRNYYRNDGRRYSRRDRDYDRGYSNRHVDRRYPDIEYIGRRNQSGYSRDRINRGVYLDDRRVRRLDGSRTARPRLNGRGSGMRELRLEDREDSGMRELVVDNRQAVVEAPYVGDGYRDRADYVAEGPDVDNPEYPYDLPGPRYGSEYISNSYAHCPDNYNCTVRGYLGRGAKLITLDKKGVPRSNYPDDEGGPKVIRLDESLEDTLGTQ